MLFFGPFCNRINTTHLSLQLAEENFQHILRISAAYLLDSNILQRCYHVCLFDCFGSVPAFVPRGQLPREDLRRAPLPPRPLVTPGPRCSSCSLSPHTYCHASCIRSVPSPVLLSYTDIITFLFLSTGLTLHTKGESRRQAQTIYYGLGSC